MSRGTISDSQTKFRHHIPVRDIHITIVRVTKNWPLLSGRSSLCLYKRGKAIGESVYINELITVADRHLPARVFSDAVIDDRFVAHEGPGFQRHIAGDVNNDFPRRICKGPDVWCCHFGPVIEHRLEVFKGLGLVLLRDAERVGASDVGVVGMKEVREGRDAHLLVRANQVVDEFELFLFSHWDETDERVKWTSVWISLGTGGSHDESMTVAI